MIFGNWGSLEIGGVVAVWSLDAMHSPIWVLIRPRKELVGQRTQLKGLCGRFGGGELQTTLSSTCIAKFGVCLWNSAGATIEVAVPFLVAHDGQDRQFIAMGINGT